MDISDFENKEGYYTLGSIFIQKRSNIMTDEIIEHECMELLPGNTQTKIRRLKERVFNSLEIPKKFKPSKKFPPIPIIPFSLLFDTKTRKNFTKNHKRFIAAQNKGGVIKSYFTRIKDGAEAPLDPQVFQDAVSRVMSSRLNIIYLNFQLELYLRVLPSKNKTFKMGIENIDGYDGSPTCTRCNVVSDSSHQAAYCIFPTYSLYALNNSTKWKSEAGVCEELNPIQLEFHTPVLGVSSKWRKQHYFD
jgi:hypothetical protein